jgi:DNA-binding transcriptional regulator YhcF (GntR family)
VKLLIDPSAAAPPFEQIRAQVADLVRGGRLPVGTRLPTVRQLAADLGLAVNTVARAYRELEQDGVVETRGRHGTFVATAGDNATRLAQEAAVAFASRVRQLGVCPPEALRMVSAALQLPPA